MIEDREALAHGLVAAAVDAAGVIMGHYENDIEIMVSHTSGLTKNTTEVLPVPDPARLVVDIRNKGPKKGSSKSINHTLLKKIRIGVHPNKTRIVFDLPYDSEPKFDSVVEGGMLGVVIFDLR